METVKLIFGHKVNSILYTLIQTKQVKHTEFQFKCLRFS